MHLVDCYELRSIDNNYAETDKILGLTKIKYINQLKHTNYVKYDVTQL